jgi:Actinobacteria/chloroflexi VLRF1 release factor
VTTPLARTVEVPLRRLEPWLAGYRLRHAEVTIRDLGAAEDALHRWQLAAADGERAVIEAHGWLAGAMGERLGSASTRGGAPGEPMFAVLVVRRAGYAVAVFRGGERLWAKVGRRHVQGRTAAGGWSQQRYARRRAHQADEIVTAVAGSFAAGASPYAPELAALATGGDRALLGQTLELLGRTDRGLAQRLAELPEVRLAIGTPTAAALAGVPDRVLSVHIHLTEAPTQKADDV